MGIIINGIKDGEKVSIPDAIAMMAAEHVDSSELFSEFEEIKMTFFELVLKLYEEGYTYEPIKFIVHTFTVMGNPYAGQLVSAVIAGRETERRIFLSHFIKYTNMKINGRSVIRVYRVKE